MNDRPSPLTDANVASLSKTPDCFCEAMEYRRQRDAYAQTLRLIAKGMYCDTRANLIHERHPELANASGMGREDETPPHADS